MELAWDGVQHILFVTKKEMGLMIYIYTKKLMALTLLLTTMACQPTDGNIDTKMIAGANKDRAILADVIRSSQEEVTPFGLVIGKATVKEALSKHPELIKAESSYVTYGNEVVQMPNTYALRLSDKLIAALQFDDSTDILQNVSIFGLKYDSFDQIKKELNSQYLPYKTFNLAEFEALGNEETTFENQREFLEKHKNEIALFKNNGVIIIIGKSVNTDDIIISYRNTKYFPVLKNKAEANIAGAKARAILADVIRSSQEEVAPFGLVIGKATVKEALSKYPELIKAESSYITYGNKVVQMPNAYALNLPNKLIAALQFDDSTDILQNVSIFGLKYDLFDQIKKELNSHYSPYEAFDLAEFEALNNGKTTFENQREFMEKHKNEIALFKNNGVIIMMGRSVNTDDIVIFYWNTKYFPVLKNKAEAN
ncbi:hypothetical protein [Neisseria zalophi]|uniref:hypothetical protein n=1 Tax=Neisseria zalophi TaxID=640030 RepID=UPI001245F98B|nr:hypothetical protein [Neisseria zalophi]